MTTDAEDEFRCYWVTKNEDDEIRGELMQRPLSDLTGQDFDGPRMRIAVKFSAVNYKDALAAQGHPGIVRRFPHIPGIDAVGHVLECDDDRFAVGETVLATGYDLGVNQHGAWASQIVTPADRVLPLPEGLSEMEAAILGTAGFTAAQCVQALLHNGIQPGDEVVVTGATGGVATTAIMLLAKLKFRVVAVTGKLDRADFLKALGAQRVVGREALSDNSKRPLLKGQFAGAVDTVGGPILETLLRSMAYRGCVAACGLTAGHELHTTVYPFLLRGITLAGIDSAMCPMESRKQIWRLLSNEWKLSELERLANRITFDDLDTTVKQILAGGCVGRSVLDLSS